MRSIGVTNAKILEAYWTHDVVKPGSLFLHAHGPGVRAIIPPLSANSREGCVHVENVQEYGLWQ
jgi:hypothetical protein